MQISEQGVELIKQFEGYRSKSYQDVIGVWTIGYGTTRINGVSVRAGMRCTEAEAAAWLKLDADEFLAEASKSITAELNQPQIDAITSFMYNVGVANFKKSTMLRKINKHDFEGAAKEFMKWINAGGKPVQGLVNRRTQEMQLFSAELT